MPPYPLEPGGAEFGKMVEAAVDLIGRFVDGLADAPASDLDLLDPVLELVGEGPGQAGRPLEELLDTVERAAAKGFETAGPGYLAFVPAGGLLSAALADLVACALNRFTGLAGPAPGLVALEAAACGTPVVAARVGGLPTIVKDGLTGFTLVSHDPAQYAERIGRLLNDEELRLCFSRRSRLVATQFSWTDTVDRLVAEYRAPRLPELQPAVAG